MNKLDERCSFIKLLYPFRFRQDFRELVAGAQADIHDNQLVWKPLKTPREALMPHVAEYINGTERVTRASWFEMNQEILLSRSGMAGGEKATWSLKKGNKLVQFGLHALELCLFRLGVGFLIVEVKPRTDDEGNVAPFLELLYRLKHLDGHRGQQLLVTCNQKGENAEFIPDLVQRSQGWSENKPFSLHAVLTAVLSRLQPGPASVVQLTGPNCETNENLRKPWQLTRTGAISISPGGELLASSGSSGEVRLFHLLTGQLIRMLKGAPDGVAALKFSTRGSILSAVNISGHLRVWDTESSRCLLSKESFVGAPHLVALSDALSQPNEGKVREEAGFVAVSRNKKNVDVVKVGDERVTWSVCTAGRISDLSLDRDDGNLFLVVVTADGQVCRYKRPSDADIFFTTASRENAEKLVDTAMEELKAELMEICRKQCPEALGHDIVLAALLKAADGFIKKPSKDLVECTQERFFRIAHAKAKANPDLLKVRSSMTGIVEQVKEELTGLIGDELRRACLQRFGKVNASAPQRPSSGEETEEEQATDTESEAERLQRAAEKVVESLGPDSKGKPPRNALNSFATLALNYAFQKVDRVSENEGLPAKEAIKQVIESTKFRKNRACVARYVLTDTDGAHSTVWDTRSNQSVLRVPTGPTDDREIEVGIYGEAPRLTVWDRFLIECWNETDDTNEKKPISLNPQDGQQFIRVFETERGLYAVCQVAQVEPWWEDIYIPDRCLTYAAAFLEDVREDQKFELLYRIRRGFPPAREIRPTDDEMTRQNSELLEYARDQWFCFNLDSTVFVAFDAPPTEFFRVTLPEHLRHQYFVPFVLVLHQRFVLSALSSDVAGSWLSSDDKVDEALRLKVFKDIQQKLLDLTARGYFRQVMQSHNHHRIYKKWQDTFIVAELYNEVSDEVSEMHDYLETRNAEQQAERAVQLESRISKIGFILGVPALTLGFFGLNIQGWTSGDGLTMGLALGISLLSFLAGLCLHGVLQKSSERDQFSSR